MQATFRDDVNQYLYNGEGQVCAMGPAPLNSITAVTQYIYDAEGSRVAKGSAHTVQLDPPNGSYVLSCDTSVNGFTVTNAYVLGPGNEQLTETDGNGVWKHTNVYAAGALIATYDSQPGNTSNPSPLHFQLADWLGTRRVQTDYAGNTEVSFTSLPFGDQLSSLPTALATAEDATEHHFTGKERDTESGNDYFGARYYASSMGRFLSPDWSAKEEPVPYAKLDNPQTLNLYAYVLNNPLSKVDPDGHDFWDKVGNLLHGKGWVDTPRPPLAQPPAPPPVPPPPPLKFKPNVPAPAPNTGLGKLMQCTNNCMNPIPIKVTSTNEKTPVHPEGTPHAKGEAWDFQPGSGKPDSSAGMMCSAQCGAGFGQNEYTHPSPHATGGHDHAQTGPGLGGSRGDLPPVNDPKQ
jgi:RHS repeat-associated protein